MSIVQQKNPTIPQSKCPQNRVAFLPEWYHIIHFFSSIHGTTKMSRYFLIFVYICCRTLEKFHIFHFIHHHQNGIATELCVECFGLAIPIRKITFIWFIIVLRIAVFFFVNSLFICCLIWCRFAFIGVADERKPTKNS